MDQKVAPPYLDRAVIIARMARALKGAPPVLMDSQSNRFRAYEQCGVDRSLYLHFRELDEAAVASELARRKAMGEG